MIQVKKTGHSLDGVEGTEYGVDIIFVRRIFFQIEDIDLYFSDVFQRLGNEIPEQRLVLDFDYLLRRGSVSWLRLCSGGADNRGFGRRNGRVFGQGRGNRGRTYCHRLPRENGYPGEKILHTAVVAARILVAVHDGLDQGNTCCQSSRSAGLVFQIIENNLFQKIG